LIKIKIDGWQGNQKNVEQAVDNSVFNPIRVTIGALEITENGHIKGIG
jgi:hypothetical protein